MLLVRFAQMHSIALERFFIPRTSLESPKNILDVSVPPLRLTLSENLNISENTF